MNLNDELSLMFGLEEDGSLADTDEASGPVEKAALELYDDAEVAISDPIDKLNEGMSNLADASVGLEEIFSTVATFLQDGGMDSKTAIMTNLAVKQACLKFPLIEMPKMPGVESYSDAGSRMEETLLGLEAEEGWVKKSLAWIRAMIAKFINMISGIWKRWTLSAASIQAKAQRIRAAIKSSSVEKSTTANAKIKLGEVDHRNLVNGGKLTSIVKGIEALASAITKTSGTTGSDTVIAQYTNAVSTVLDTFKPTEAGADGVIKKFDKTFDLNEAANIFKGKGGISYTESTDPKLTAEENVVNLVSNTFIGGKRVVVKLKGAKGILAKFGGKNKGLFKGLTVTLGNAGEVKTSGKSVEVSGISLNDCTNILDEIISLTDAIAKAKTNSGARATALKSVEAAAKKVETTMSTGKLKETSPELYAYARAYITACSTLPQALYNPGTDLARHGLVVSKSAINFVVHNYKAITAEEAA